MRLRARGCPTIDRLFSQIRADTLGRLSPTLGVRDAAISIEMAGNAIYGVRSRTSRRTSKIISTSSSVVIQLSNANRIAALPSHTVVLA